MAYGLKYELLCTSKIAKNAYTLQILFDGYSSSDVDRNMPASSPIVLRKDAAAVIRGTSLEFAIREEVDWEFDEFYTNNPKQIQVVLYDPDSVPIWYGYVLPQQYQAPYIPSPNTVRFTATDGLGLLKEQSFTLTGRVSQLAIIVNCMATIGLQLSYSIAINLYESTHDTSESPLAQTYEDAERYINKNCYEVLEAILSKYDAEITQVNGQWHITASDSKESYPFVYTYEGVYESVTSYPATLTLNYPGKGDVYPVGSLNRSMEPGARKVTLSHDYGRKKSLLSNYDFSQFVNDEFTDWTKTGSFSTYQNIDEGKTCAYLEGYSSIKTQKIEQGIDVVNVPGESFVFEIDFAPSGRSYTPGDGSFVPMSATVRMVVAIQINAVNYFLSINKEAGSASWVTTPTFIEETVTSGLSTPVWNHFKAVTAELPGDGTLFVSLYRCYFGTPLRPGGTYFGTWFSEPLVYFTQNGQLYPSAVKMTATFDNSTEPGDLGEINIIVADAPDLPNNSLLYTNITRLSDDTPTNLWVRLGEASEYTLIAQLARLLASKNRIARQKLTGTLRGSSIQPNSIITHAYNSNRKFEIAEMSWDLYNETFDVTLIELLSWSSEAITFTVESSTSAGGSSTSGVIIGTIGGNDAVQTNMAFQTPAFADPLDLDAAMYKNFKPGIATGNTVINVLNANDGDIGLIELIIDGTGGYTVTMGTMFTKRIGSAEIDTAAGADNFIVWRKIIDDYVYEVLGASDLNSGAVLALTAITILSIYAERNAEFDVDYTIENSGATAGTGDVDWKTVLAGDIVSEGSFRCASVDPATPLTDVVTLIAPPELGQYEVWVKMRTDAAWSFYVMLYVEYQIVGTGIFNIANGANDSILIATVSVDNIGAAGSYYLDWEMMNSGAVVIDSGTEYAYIDSGESNIDIELQYPHTAQEDLYMSVTIRGFSESPTLSNEFNSVEVTMNHIDTVGSQVHDTAFDNITIEITAYTYCTFYAVWNIRNSSHLSKGGGYFTFNLTPGTNTYSITGTIPGADSIGSNNDIIIQKDSTISVTSNHFTIT